MHAFEGSVFTWFAHEHPAFVHLPIAASLLLPVPLALSLRRSGWMPAARLLAWAAAAGGLAALASGLLWARSLELIPPAAFLPARPGLIATHEELALGGLAAGLMVLCLLETKRTRLALASSLLWAALWGAAGHWGGRMVFPDTESVSQIHALTEAPWATSA